MGRRTLWLSRKSLCSPESLLGSLAARLLRSVAWSRLPGSGLCSSGSRVMDDAERGNAASRREHRELAASSCSPAG